MISATFANRFGGSTSFVISADTYFHIGSNDIAAAGLLVYTSVWGNVTTLCTLDVAFAADLAAHGTPHWWLVDYGLTNGGASFDEAETNDTFDANSEGRVAQTAKFLGINIPFNRDTALNGSR